MSGRGGRTGGDTDGGRPTGATSDAMEKATILYADDEEANLSNLRLTLRDEYRVVTARSGAEALERLAETPDVAVVLADHRMPGMTGVELLERVLATNPEPIRMIVTAYVNVEDVLDAINRGSVYHYLLKPWDEASLRTTLGRARDAYKLARENERLRLELAARNEELEDWNRRLEAEVRERTADLERARDELEERVEARTAELQQAHRQLLHAEKLSAVGRLSASIAHEFNNPVFGIRNVLEGLRAHPGLGDDDREMVALASGECARIARLVRDLQDFYRPTSGRPAPVDVERAVEAMLLFCRKDLETKKIRVRREYAADLPLVRAVEDQLRQVVLNLLANATDAIGDGGGMIRVATLRRDGEVAVRVADTGQGIAPENLERVFEPFFTTKTSIRGTGLGLPVSHGIVERHGGRIEVASTPGEGSTFTVWLPIGGPDA